MTMHVRWKKSSNKILLSCVIIFTSLVFIINVLPRDFIVECLLDDNYFTLRKTRVTPLDFDFVISGPAGCRTDDSPLMVVLVLTVHDHVEERKAIRETWGSVARTKQWGKDYIPASVMVLFLLGSPDDPSKSERAKEENEKFHDIVEANFKDSYYNLTYKVLMGFKWVKQFCPSAKYVMKIDEDTFISVKKVVHKIKNTYLDSGLGPYYVTSLVHRSGKFRVEKENYPFLIYPPHMKGNFYLMPTRLAFSVLNASEYMPYVCMEDAHITGILFKVVGGKHVGLSTSAYDPALESGPEVCYFMRPQTLAAQNVSADLARQIWKTVLGDHKC